MFLKKLPNLKNQTISLELAVDIESLINNSLNNSHKIIQNASTNSDIIPETESRFIEIQARLDKANNQTKKTKTHTSKPIKCLFKTTGNCVVKNCPTPHFQPEKQTCRFHRAGRCIQLECPFSHDLKGDACLFYHLKGNCNNGDSCLFSHSPITPEQREQLEAKRKRYESMKIVDVPVAIQEEETMEEADLSFDTEIEDVFF